MSEIVIVNASSGRAACFAVKEGAGWISAYETSMIASLFPLFRFGYVERDDPCGFGIDVRYPTVVAFGRQGRICDGVFDRVFDLERSSFGRNIEALFGEYDFRLCIRCDGIVVVTPGKERGTQNPPRRSSTTIRI